MTGRLVPPGEVHATLSRTILADGFDIVLDLDKSHGSWLRDAKSGREYLDLFSCFASLPLGYNHPGLLTSESQSRLARAATHKPSNSDLYSSEMATFVETFRRLAMPRDFVHGFFISGGTLAVENALKAAFDYKVQRNFRKLKTSDEIGTEVAHFRQAFHGRSGYALSLTNTLPDKIRYFPKFPWPRFDTPGLSFPRDAATDRAVAAREDEVLGKIREYGRQRGDHVAAIILEPIQGEGGDVHFRPEFLAGLRKIADEFDWMLIFDEVQTGFGTTGTMWAHEQLGTVPDMVCFGKKSQICGFMATGRIDALETNVFKVPSRINSTWGGSLVDMVRCTLHLEIMESEKLVAHAQKRGDVLLRGLQSLAEEFPSKISNARGRGLLCAFDTVDDGARRRLLAGLMEREVVILPCGPRSIRFRPALTITEQDIQKGLDRIRDALRQV